ncbi:MAG: hypothetical protein HQL22_10765, partial [Candidatus Omnitrophica bacterium]|nr:hypothetical protein [Candidatus Omnitrophota bacterium]
WYSPKILVEGFRTALHQEDDKEAADEGAHDEKKGLFETFPWLLDVEKIIWEVFEGKTYDGDEPIKNVRKRFSFATLTSIAKKMKELALSPEEAVDGRVNPPAAVDISAAQDSAEESVRSRVEDALEAMLEAKTRKGVWDGARQAMNLLLDASRINEADQESILLALRNVLTSKTVVELEAAEIAADNLLARLAIEKARRKNVRGLRSVVKKAPAAAVNLKTLLAAIERVIVSDQEQAVSRWVREGQWDKVAAVIKQRKTAQNWAVQRERQARERQAENISELVYMTDLSTKILVAVCEQTIREDKGRVFMQSPAFILLSKDVQFYFQANAGSDDSLQNDPGQAMKVPGGIDLNANTMGLDRDHVGKGIDLTLDSAMVAEFRQGNFTGVEGVILKIVPFSVSRSLLGLVTSGSGI